MPRPGPRRRPVPLRLSAAEEAPVQRLAADMQPMPNGSLNLSAALRRIIAEWVEQHPEYANPDEVKANAR